MAMGMTVTSGSSGKMDKVVYQAIFNGDGRVYIGQTDNLARRINHHLNQNYYFGNTLKKYGIERFTWQILLHCNSKQEMDFWEKLYIKELNTVRPNGFNLTEGGDGGTLHLPEIREKQREALKITQNRLEFKRKTSKRMRKNNPMSNPKHQLTHKKAIAGKQAGDKNSMYGRKRPDMSKRMIDLWQSLEYRRTHVSFGNKNLNIN